MNDTEEIDGSDTVSKVSEIDQNSTEPASHGDY